MGYRAVRLLAAAAIAVLLPATVPAQSALKYRDASGQWIFTDHPGALPAQAGQSLQLAHEAAAPRISVQLEEQAGTRRLIARNGCLCTITVHVTIEESAVPRIARGSLYDATLAGGSEQALLELRGADGAGRLRFTWTTGLGAPDAVHRPERPYRVPFAPGASFMVSQAYPTHITHVTPDSTYAVDIALPDGTPVYAARGGTVIDVRHDAFLGATDAALVDQANMVEILHADGTIAVYAHLEWDAIRVRVGQHVAAGEYLANSGNTGFTSGPHLHFAVWRNARGTDVSVPIQFAGPGGIAVTPTTGVPLTAY